MCEGEKERGRDEGGKGRREGCHWGEQSLAAACPSPPRSAKKKREPGSTKISQTPDGSFYDLMRNGWHLLQQCGVRGLPELGSVEQYLANGPGFIFLYNPALGERGGEG